MANKLRNNKDIKGIKVCDITYLLSQFADDTDLYLSYDQKTVSTVFSVLSDVEHSTGLRISYDKTTMYRIGSIANSNAKLFTHRRICWSNNFITTLGIDIANSPRGLDRNYTGILSKMRTVSKMWYYRSMTLTGKVLIVNTLMSSLFVYKMQILPVISDRFVAEVEEVILDFLWHGKRPKISLNTLKANTEDGGLGLIDIQTKHRALLCNWISDCKNYENIGNLAKYFLGRDTNFKHLWEYNLNYNDSVKCLPGTDFWSSIVHMWHKYRFDDPQSGERVRKQIIAFNSNIRVQSEPVTSGWWRESGATINDIWCEDRVRFCTYNEYVKKTGASCNWLNYQSVINAIPAHWKFFLKSDVNLVDDRLSKYEMIKDIDKVSRLIYRDMLHTDEILRKCVHTWGKKACINTDVQKMRKHFCNIKGITPVTKLRNFQFRLLHNKIFCNDVLVHWKKVESNICDFCSLQKQTIIHLLYDCPRVKNLWEYLIDQVSVKQITMDLSFETILFNNVVNENTYNVCNLLVLITKFYIYRCKCAGIIPTISELTYEIRFYFKLEVNIVNISNIRKILCKWEPVRQLLS